MSRKAYLVFENGLSFEGRSFGAERETVGETVFTTSMTGCMKTLTDPSYYGQIVMQTFPQIGNCGLIRGDFESDKLWPSAYVVREKCDDPSNFRMEGTLDELLKSSGVPGIEGLPTRDITKIIRQNGTLNAALVYSPEVSAELTERIRGYRVTGAVEAVTCGRAETVTPEGATRRVVLMDYGAKEHIRRQLLKRGCEVIKLPAGTSAKEIMSYKPDGLMLSNGPGDPAVNKAMIAELRQMVDTGIPTFGICLGHQLLALAMGGRTQRLKFGHRGANQPVKELSSGRVYITSQNHGYTVLSNSLPDGARASFVNANDGTCEGVEYGGTPVFSVQFHPEGNGGPLDTTFLFDRFVAVIDERKGR